MRRSIGIGSIVVTAMVAACGGSTATQGTGGGTGTTNSSGGAGGSSCQAPLVSCQGACVDTATDAAHCGSCGVACSAGEACAAGQCVAPTCTDAVKNGGETDVDCGGSCAPCVDGKACAVAADCASFVCTNGVCAAPTCTDAVKNGDESDVDCGGSCGACADGKTCSTAADCTSLVCMSGVCAAPTCTDAVKNGAEIDVDCGGTCPACADGKACSAASDCASGVCTGGICQAPVCTDEVKNGTESDVDCGGTCPACFDGKACNGPSDCESGVCTGGVCQAPTCTDGVKNGAEGDVDCGGACPACSVGSACGAGGDCTTGLCAAGTCTAAAGCKALKAANASLPSAVYVVDLDGSGPRAPVAAYCDMTTDSGGWTYAMIVNTTSASANRSRLAGLTTFGTAAPPGPATEYGIDLTGVTFREVRIDNFTKPASVKHTASADITWDATTYTGNTGFTAKRIVLGDGWDLRAGYYGSGSGCADLANVNIPVCFTVSGNPIGWVCDTDNNGVEGMMDCSAGELCGAGFYYAKKVWRDSACTSYLSTTAVYGFAVR